MTVFSIRLCGKFSATCDDQSVKCLESRKLQELLSYLLLFRDRPHSREILASTLWADTPALQARANLRKALWQLQAALGDGRESSSDALLSLEADWVQINPQANLWLDVALIDAASLQVQGRPGETLSDQQIATVSAAVVEYHGDLLEGWYSEWCLYERGRLQNIYLALVDKLMAACESSHAYEQGIVYGAEVLRYDRAREETHRRLMRLYCLAGDRTAALRQYDRCVAALDEELGVCPTEYTMALREQIRVEALGAVVAEPHESGFGPTLRESLTSMRQIQGVLSDMQQRVQQHISAVEHALRQGQ